MQPAPIVRRFVRPLCTLLPILTVLLLPIDTLPALAEDLNPEEVRAAIDRSVAYLKREQARNGSWPDFAANEGGVTSLCTLALLNAGVKPEDESIQRALISLRKLPPKWTYATSLQTMVFCAASPRQDAVLILKNVHWLEATQIKTGTNKGAWSYPRAGGDNSNAQFAMLALFEAALTGTQVNSSTWRLALDYWKRTQNADGSWGYQPGQPGTGSMTCAGIAAVVMAQSQLDEGDAKIQDGQIQCCGQSERDPTLERALSWLGTVFSVHVNPGRGDAWLFYYLYGVERVGRMTARRFIGDHDWYREGTEMLVRNQDRLSGFWIGAGHGETNPHIGTSLALLFLAKGQRPILMNKMRHSGDDWNCHASDVAHLTHFVETRWQRDLSWQVIDIAAATPDDLLQAPVLYMNGSAAPHLSEAERKTLREYIDQGGFLFAVASCRGTFDTGFRELMQKVFPEAEYELKLLPPDHPVWHAEQPVAANELHPLYGINVGCRTSVIYCPDDLSCMWELARPGRESQLREGPREKVLGAMAIGINVLAYATNREVKYKFEIPAIVNGQQQQDRIERAKLYIAKLRHTGGWDSAPRALISLQEGLARETGLRVGTERRDVSLADPKLFEYPVVFMHGRNTFHLSATERDRLRTFVERGGVLIADSVCASPAFTASFREEMQATFGGQALEPIPPGHAMFTAAYGGFELPVVQRRDPQRGGGARLEAQIRKVPPALEGMKIGDRYGVLFSPYDLSCALEKHESLDCQGYLREDAARIAINAILYALNE